LKTKQIIQAYTLKHFLSLFDGKSIVENLQLGDTAHPSNGFVDGTILRGKNTVQDVLDFTYSFQGLVLFTCTINDIDIEYKNDTYELIGEDRKLKALSYKIAAPNFNIEINAKWRISKNTLYDATHCDQECVLLATYKDYFVDVRESHILTVIMCYILMSSYFLSFSLRRKAMCGKSTVV
jgi:hypothetical protein